MKKVILISVLFLGTIAFANAQFTTQGQETAQTETVAQAAQQKDWKEVKLEDLNENVQAAIAVLLETNDLTSLAYNEAAKQTKVTVTSKDGAKTEKIVILNDEGNEVVEEKEEA